MIAAFHHWRYYFALIALVLLAACDQHEDSAQEGSTPAYEQVITGEGYAIELTADRTEMSIADRLTITLTPQSDEREFRELGVEPIEAGRWIVHQREWKTDPLDTSPIAQTHLVLEPYTPGDLEAPEFRITPLFADDTQGTPVVSERFPVTVTSVLSDEDTDIAGAKGVVDPPAPVWWRRPLVIGVILGGLLLLAITLIARRMLSRVVVDEASIPCDEAALARLDELRRSGMMHPDSMDRFYYALSEILRWYIEQQFSINAPDLTTEEFLEMASHSHTIRDADLELLGRFMSHCDRVKFAKEQVGTDQANRSMDTVKSFINRTTPTSAPTPEVDA